MENLTGEMEMDGTKQAMELQKQPREGILLVDHFLPPATIFEN